MVPVDWFWGRLPEGWAGFPEGSATSEESAPTRAATGYARASGTSTVPTTKVLAIGRWTEQGTPSARLPILRSTSHTKDLLLHKGDSKPPQCARSACRNCA